MQTSWIYWGGEGGAQGKPSLRGNWSIKALNCCKEASAVGAEGARSETPLGRSRLPRSLLGLSFLLSDMGSH